MLEDEVLVGEPLTVDALATHSVSSRDVSSLDHEVGNDAMEYRSLIPQRLSLLANSHVSLAECEEVLHCFRNSLTISSDERR